MGKTLSALDLSLSEWQGYFREIGLPNFRGRQVWEGLYKNLYTESSSFTNIPKDLRGKIFDAYPLQTLTLEKSVKSKDGETEKVLFRLDSGNLIETVLMNYDERNTVCVSTQSGCAMGCVFCATGQMGFYENLSSGEIIGQILHFERKLRSSGEKLTNIVFMGMGEPFHNYDNVLKAIRVLNDASGFNFGARRFTISTVGLIPQILRLAKEEIQVNLAISLHAANNELRSSMMPVNRKYPVEELIAACRDYVQETHRRVTFEYALVSDVNDHPENASDLALLLKGFNCHVNLIPLNPTKKYQRSGSSRERAAAFKAVLDEAGIPCTIRMRRGIDINAGCGQLASSVVKPSA
ncbi:MAG TPA: 23S rRNA (adenine(2503)-C(2))-methyltransferase RlmN [Bellilinea sp.]|nr:23S rRNA (adenine(2503)-C(2))-methyltransferase RlmN [Bellilinea sp.]